MEQELGPQGRALFDSFPIGVSQRMFTHPRHVGTKAEVVGHTSAGRLVESRALFGSCTIRRAVPGLFWRTPQLNACIRGGWLVKGALTSQRCLQADISAQTRSMAGFDPLLNASLAHAQVMKADFWRYLVLYKWVVGRACIHVTCDKCFPGTSYASRQRCAAQVASSRSCEFMACAAHVRMHGMRVTCACAASSWLPGACRHGGVYADVDVISEKPMTSWLPPQDGGAKGLPLEVRLVVPSFACHAPCIMHLAHHQLHEHEVSSTLEDDLTSL